MSFRRGPVAVRPGTDAWALLGWAALLVAAILWGRHLLPQGHLNVSSPPFLGLPRWAPVEQLPALAVAGAFILTVPYLAGRLPWRLALVLAWAAAAIWAVALGIGDGHPTLGGVLNQSSEYLPAVRTVRSPGDFLSGFADAVAHLRYPVHVNGHPPLMVLVLWGWDRLGASGPAWAAALVIGVGASSVMAVATTLRTVAGETAARRTLPFLILGPFAITVATSADAFFLGVTSWAAAALAVGLHHRSRPVLVLAGLLAGAVPYLSYGLVPFGVVLVAVAVLVFRRDGMPSTRRTGLSVTAAFIGGLLVVPLAMSAAGFWWLDGVRATHVAWVAGRGDDRPYLYSFLADLAVLAALTGPATAVAATRRASVATTLLPGAAFAAVLSLAAAGVTRLEVERIWLPFAPWIVVLTLSLSGRVRLWLAANAAVALVFQTLVLGGW